MPTDTFTGPPCTDLVAFMKSIKDMPAKHKPAFDAMSKKTIEAVCDIDALHVWESGDDLDDLLQLSQVVMKLRMEAGKGEGKGKKVAAMVVVSCEKGEYHGVVGERRVANVWTGAARGKRNAFDRICELVGHVTSMEGKKHLNGLVCAFDAVVVVRGISYSPNSDEKGAIRRINTAIERVFKMQRPSTKQLVWHHGPTLSLLLTWINTTTSELRSSLNAISITAALDLTSGVKPSPLGKSNTPSDLKRLQEYAERLDIPVIFVDPNSQLITFGHLSTYMYFWASYIHLLLPASLMKPHLHLGLDALVTFCFRLLSASTSTYGSSTVRLVKEHLTASLAQPWARTCIDPNSYTKSACRSAGTDSQIHDAVELSDAPFGTFTSNSTYPLPAFSRLPLCPVENPSTSTTGQSYFAPPVSFEFNTCAMRVDSKARFYVLLPGSGMGVENVTNCMRGTMMGVVEYLRREKEKQGVTLRVNKGEKEVWSEVLKACKWAVGQCHGKMPEGVETKVGYVGKNFGGGTYTSTVGMGNATVRKARTGGEWHAEKASQGWGRYGDRGMVMGMGGYGGGDREWWRRGGNEGGWSSGAATVGSSWD